MIPMVIPQYPSLSTPTLPQTPFFPHTSLLVDNPKLTQLLMLKPESSFTLFFLNYTPQPVTVYSGSVDSPSKCIQNQVTLMTFTSTPLVVRLQCVNLILAKGIRKAHCWVSLGGSWSCDPAVCV